MDDADRPSSDSLANRFIKFGLTASVTLGSSWLPIPPVWQNTLGIAAVAAILKGYDRVYAAAFVNRNHQPQILYEIPWQDGIVVVQPRHRLEWNEYHPWRLRLRDVRTDEVYRLRGYFANTALADQYCQNRKVGRGILLPPDESDPVFGQLIHNALTLIPQQFAHRFPRRVVPENPWLIARVEPQAYVALHRVLTPEGSRWEFYPRPPASLPDTVRLKEQLQEQGLRDPQLDRRRLDEGLEGLPPTARQAWQRQSVSWTLVPINPTHNAWVAKSVAPDGSVAWYPPVPKTLSQTALLTDLRPDLAPNQADPPVSPDAHNFALWHQAVWHTRNFPTQAAGELPWSHPLAANLRHTVSSQKRTWMVVPVPSDPNQLTPSRSQQWMALGLIPKTRGLVLEVLRDPVHPQHIWCAPTAAAMQDTVTRIWPQDSVVSNSNPFPWQDVVKPSSPAPARPSMKISRPFHLH